MFLLTDFVVYLWNFPNPNASLATLKKYSINPLTGFKSFHCSILFINIVFNILYSFLDLS